MKHYAVKNGRDGAKIYDTWTECKTAITGIKGVKFRKFNNMYDAKAFLVDAEVYSKNDQLTFDTPDPETTTQTPSKKAIAYVDGSFNPETNEYACGVVLMHNNTTKTISEKFTNDQMVHMHNVAGEIMGSIRAIQTAMSLDIDTLEIYHDYQGIASWPNGTWRANKVWTQDYADTVNNARKLININFIKVKGHSSDKYNDMADQLAKQALGLA